MPLLLLPSCVMYINLDARKGGVAWYLLLDHMPVLVVNCQYN